MWEAKFCVVVLVETLGKPPPIWQEANDDLPPIQLDTLLFQILNWLVRVEISLRHKTSHGCCRFKTCRHRCDYVCKKEMAKAYLTERTYQDVPYSFQQLDSPFEIH